MGVMPGGIANAIAEKSLMLFQKACLMEKPKAVDVTNLNTGESDLQNMECVTQGWHISGIA